MAVFIGLTIKGENGIIFDNSRQNKMKGYTFISCL